MMSRRLRRRRPSGRRACYLRKLTIGFVYVLYTSINSHAFLAQTMTSRRRKNRLRQSAFLPLEAHHKYLATCIPGLAPVVEKELRSLDGVTNVQTSGAAGVLFEGDSARVGLAALLWTRATIRIMEFVAEASGIETRQDLYDFISHEVDVKDLLGDGKGGLLTLSVRVVLSGRDIPPDINHSHYTALTIKNALVDNVREKRGDRPNVDIDNADVPLLATIRGGVDTSISLYRCLHNGSLHRRGYRSNQNIHKAAMKESMAAGLLLAIDHDFYTNMVIVDPMAGSGSLIVEAAMIAADLAPGLMRIKCGQQGASMPPVVRWKSDEEDAVQLWKELLVDATERAKSGLQRLRTSESKRIIANDVHPGALDLLEDSLDKAGLQDLVEVHQGDCQDLVLPGTRKCLVVTNPPWDVRLSDDMHESWESLRVFLRENCAPGTEAWVLSGNKQATKHLGLRRSQSLVLQTGQQDLRWLQYKILDKTTTAARHKHDNDRQSEPARQERQRPNQTRQASAQLSRGNRDDSHGFERSRSVATSNKNGARGYERRNRVAPSFNKDGDDKSVTKPLTQAERDERKNSWYI